MEMEKLQKYININLKSRLKFKERYYIDQNNENNTINIKTVFRLSEVNLFDQIIKDQMIAIYFIDDMLNIIKSIDNNIIDINLSINMCDNQFIAFNIIKIRDPTLINILDMLPNEIITYIISLVDIQNIKYFGITSTKNYTLIHQPNFWLYKCADVFAMTINSIKCGVNELQFKDYKKLLNIYLSLKKNYGFISYKLSDNKYLIMLIKLNLLTVYEIRLLIVKIYDTIIDNYMYIDMYNYINDNIIKLIITKYINTKVFREYEIILIKKILGYLRCEDLIKLF